MTIRLLKSSLSLLNLYLVEKYRLFLKNIYIYFNNILEVICQYLLHERLIIISIFINTISKIYLFNSQITSVVLWIILNTHFIKRKKKCMRSHSSKECRPTLSIYHHKYNYKHRAHHLPQYIAKLKVKFV